MIRYGEVRAQAAEAAHRHIRHLLYPETVHLLSIADIGEAVTVASDILAPAERAAAEQFDAVAGRCEQLLAERDEAVHYADSLSAGLGDLLEHDVRSMLAPTARWRFALDLLAQLVAVNARPVTRRRAP